MRHAGAWEPHPREEVVPGGAVRGSKMIGYELASRVNGILISSSSRSMPST